MTSFLLLCAFPQQLFHPSDSLSPFLFWFPLDFRYLLQCVCRGRGVLLPPSPKLPVPCPPPLPSLPSVSLRWRHCTALSNLMLISAWRVCWGNECVYTHVHVCACVLVCYLCLSLLYWGSCHSQRAISKVSSLMQGLSKYLWSWIATKIEERLQSSRWEYCPRTESQPWFIVSW